MQIKVEHVTSLLNSGTAIIIHAMGLLSELQKESPQKSVLAQHLSGIGSQITEIGFTIRDIQEGQDHN